MAAHDDGKVTVYITMRGWDAGGAGGGRAGGGSREGDGEGQRGEKRIHGGT